MSNASKNSRLRAWAWYAVAWTPIALCYAVPMARTRPMSVEQSLLQGFTHVIPAALLGIVVWRFTAIVAWPPRSRWRFVAVHLVGAIAMSVAWLGFEVGLIARYTGWTEAIE